MELVRISTAGSVDDGKSTLIGRLLFDNNALTKEQEELIDQKTREKGTNDLELSVITDGLVAEREQGITIDVAHIYFSTDTHKFIIADSPGHVEYTRNMVTGASTAETSIILIDARKGLLEQSFRHFYISHLLRMEKVIFCVNKMDLVDFNEDRFIEIAVQVKEMVNKIGDDIAYDIVPISSLKGDNVVHKSEQMDWYNGKTLNELLHLNKSKINLSKAKYDQPFRFDVQQVYHTHREGFQDFRGFAGRIKSGTLSVGDKIITLPSKKESTVKEIRRFTDTLDTANAGDSIIISLTDEIDISRGSLIAKLEEQPKELKEFDATLVWMDDNSAQIGSKLILKAGATESLLKIQKINYKVDTSNLEKDLESSEIELNDIVSATLKLSKPVYLDNYDDNKRNGVFILIDQQTNNTVAVGFKK
jgi:sulfate adenylyltransferase subunit 1